MENTKSAMPQDFKRDIDWILDAYDLAGVTLPDGFQKDAIQNAVGARQKDSWNGWKCKIDLVNNGKGSFLIIEDEGTLGLTGPNISADEITEKIKNDEKFDSSWRLARFSSRNVSGGNTTGAGKYGVGKSVYSACSEDYDYCFDSLREDGVYVANRIDKGEIFSKALENDDAKKYILETTGLSEKTAVGTRVIIFNPKKVICDSINDESIVDFIQESWWRCIEKMPLDCGIFINGNRVEVPVLPLCEHEYELSSPEKQAEGYRVKKFGFFIKNNKNEGWNGISYYRMGMKIGMIDLSDLPVSVKDRFWGFIEVDKEWEERLSEIEDAVHYGVKRGGKHTSQYQNLRLYVSTKVNQLLTNWGYIKDKDFEDKKLQEALKEISTELQELFDEIGFEDLGNGPKKPDFSVRWKDVQYPVEGSESVTSGDVISFGFRISNNYLSDKKFSYKLQVVSKADNRIVSVLESGEEKILSGECYDGQYNFGVSADYAERYEENRIVLIVSPAGSTKEKYKELPFFYDIEKEDNSRREVLLSLHSMQYPRENSRRVNFGEKLTNIQYLVDNKRNIELSFCLNLSIHNCEDPSNPKIVDVCSIKSSVGPYEEAVISDIPTISFEQEDYEEYLSAGVLELRARLIAMDDSDEYEKGDRITHYYQKVYLNIDEKNGKEGSFEPRTDDAPEDYRRSWCKAGNRLIYINSGHPAYKAVQLDDEEWRSYMKQEMLKQYVMLYLEEGKYSMFGNGEDITEMDPIEAGKCIMDKVEEVYQKSFR